MKQRKGRKSCKKQTDKNKAKKKKYEYHWKIKNIKTNESKNTMEKTEETQKVRDKEEKHKGE